MIKRIIKYTILAIILIAISFWGYLWYQNWRSFQVNCPNQTDRLIRINLEQIGKKYIKSEVQAKGTEMFKLLKSAIDIPFNVFAFGVKKVSANVFFTKLNINNRDSFDRLVNEQFPIIGQRKRSTKNGLISLMHNDKDAVIIWGNDTSDHVIELANSYLNDRQTQKFSESKLFSIKTKNADLSSTGNMYNISLNFEHGAIKGKLISHVQQIAENTLEVPKDASLAIISKENITIVLQRLGINNLLPEVPTEALMADFKPGFAIYLKGETEQTKTAISYQYDDNFEKVAVEEHANIMVPDFKIMMLLNEQKNALSQLKRTSILIGQDSVNKNIFPLYALHYSVRPAQRLSVFTSLTDDTTMQETISMDKDADILTWIDFQALSKMESLKDIRQYLSVFDQFNIKHQSGDSYDITLSFLDKNQSSLKQILKLIKSN